MISLNYLPELVVHHILKYAMENAYMFKRQLSYLAVCHTWRHVALPLVYRTAYVHTSTYSNPAKWRSNIDLLLSSGYSMFVKHLDVFYFYVAKEAVEELGSFLNTLGIGPVQLPADYQQKFVTSNDDNERQHYRDEQPVIMDEDLLQLVQESANKFAQKFPKIKSLELRESTKYSFSRQIYDVLVNAFADQLRSLASTYLYVKDLTCSLDTLTSFTYKCDNRLHLLLPRVNALPLEKLHIVDIPNDFSWRFFQKEPNSNEPVIFPNLKDLELTFELNGFPSHNRNVSDNATRVHLPKLQKLKYKNEGKFVFQPEIIPSHLDSVYLGVTGDGFAAFSKLPIESIGCFCFLLYDKPSDMSEFRIAADHLFNAIKHSGRTEVDLGHVFIYEIGGIDWQNVNYIGLDNAYIQEIADVINNMPQVTSIRIELMYCAGPENRLYVHPGVSKLEKLYILKSDLDDWKVTSDHIVEMLKCLECLQSLKVRQYMADYIKEKVQGLVEDYPWLKDLKIGMKDD